MALIYKSVVKHRIKLSLQLFILIELIAVVCCKDCVLMQFVNVMCVVVCEAAGEDSDCELELCSHHTPHHHVFTVTETILKPSRVLIQL